MLRALDKWGLGWLTQWLQRPRNGRLNEDCHVLVSLADHFEPSRERAEPSEARRFVHAWLDDYRRTMAGFRDADGRPPRHTFFYAGDAYDRDCVESLASFCAEGWGETEIHWHHRNDTDAALEQHLAAYRDRLHNDHGLLGRDAAGRIRYGFVHGNWALCNSRPDGDWCGVNRELAVLARTGCYADFTFPSAPSATQARTVNRLYRAVDRRDGRPRGHDHGVAVRVDGPPPAPDAVLMVPGPLTVDLGRRKWGILPRIENAECSGVNPPHIRRLPIWLAPWIHVAGQSPWVFIKLHTHGCVAANRSAVVGAAAQAWHRDLASFFADPRHGKFHYVTTREMVNVIRAAECGKTGDPSAWFDYEVSPPPVAESVGLSLSCGRSRAC